MEHKETFYSDVPFTKAAVGSGDLKLLGYASTWTLDRDNEVVLPTAFEGSLEKYLSQNPILLWQHDQHKPIGTVENAFTDEHGLNVKCHVPKPDDREPDWTHLAYNKIKAGIVRTFSIGGFFQKSAMRGGRGGRVIERTNIFEISVVSIPANPDSIFAAAVKSLSSNHRPDLTPEAIRQMAQVTDMIPITDLEITMMGKDEREERYKALADMYRQSGVRPPSFDGWRNLMAKGRPDPTNVPAVMQFYPLVKQIREEQQGRVRENDAPLAEQEEEMEQLKEIAALASELTKIVQSGANLTEAHMAKAVQAQKSLTEVVAKRAREQGGEKDNQKAIQSQVIADPEPRDSFGIPVSTHYRTATNDDQSCGSCAWFSTSADGSGSCKLWEAQVDDDCVCDSFSCPPDDGSKDDDNDSENASADSGNAINYLSDATAGSGGLDLTMMDGG